MNMVIEELWRVLCKKVQLETQQLVEVDCKEDETIDDICQMTFN